LGIETRALQAIDGDGTGWQASDRFAAREDFAAALRELARVLRPCGLIILTHDNPLSVLYWPLRWFSSRRAVSFGLHAAPRGVPAAA
jgi:SAM-dependent methyltransferase